MKTIVVADALMGVSTTSPFLTALDPAAFTMMEAAELLRLGKVGLQPGSARATMVCTPLLSSSSWYLPLVSDLAPALAPEVTTRLPGAVSSQPASQSA